MWLKERGIRREYLNLDNGKMEYKSWPDTPEEALKEGVRFFLPNPSENICTRPSHYGQYSVRYAISGKPRCCAIQDAYEAYQKAIKDGEPLCLNDAICQAEDYYFASGRENHQCGHIDKRTQDGKCYECEEMKASKKKNIVEVVKGPSSRQIASLKNEEWYMPNKPCKFGHIAPRRVSNGSCQECERIKSEAKKLVKPQSPRQLAIAAGNSWYMSTEPCKNGHMALRRVQDGACKECLNGLKSTGNSPRQLAIAAGENWYMPTEPCKNGHIALRHVYNGSCKECMTKPKKSVRTPSIQDLYPDMIISRNDAIMAGMKVYRTGEPCRRGHRGFRWVSTKNCLVCMKEDSKK